MTDPYKVLGVSRDASEEEIKQWLEDGNAEFIEYVKHLDTESAEFAFDYEFEIGEYSQ